MIQDIDLTNFTAGEVSPLFAGRFDMAKYFTSCKTLRNFVVMPQGGITTRPGTLYVSTPPDQTDGEQLVPFIFSTSQAYVLGFGNYYASVYADDAVVTSGGSPVTVATPYPANVTAQLGYAQSFDQLFLTQNGYPPQVLSRTGATTFSMAAMVFLDGPYEPVNTSTNRVTVSGRTGTITLVWDNTTGINGGTGFTASDVGRFVRINLMGVWAWLIINAVTGGTVVTATVQPKVNNGAWEALDGAPWIADHEYIAGYAILGPDGTSNYVCTVAGLSGTAGPTGTALVSGTYGPIVDGTATWKYLPTGIPTQTTNWAISKWCPANGYPALVSFWQNRLILAGSLESPNVIEGSVTGDFTNFAPTGPDGTVTDSNAFSWNITDSEANNVCWLSPAGAAQAMQLGIGTTGGEEIIQASATSAALTPTNVQAYQETALGGSYARALRIQKSVLFLNRTGKKVHEWTFTWQVNGYLGPDLAVLAEHITRPIPAAPDALGLLQIVYQQSPHSIVWGRRSDGALVALTYLRDQDVVAWHAHQLGGQYYGGAPRVESLCVIPSPQGGYDELWLEVLRTINGVPTRTVEVMTPYFIGVSLDLAWQVDCAIRNVLATPGSSLTPSGFTVSTDPDKPPTFSGTGALVSGVALFSAASIGSIVRINGGKLAITGFQNANLVAAQVLEPMTSLAPAAAGAWTFGAPLSTVSGLGYLAGETVAMVGDGQVLPQQQAAASLTLATPATLITAGLPFKAAAVTMPFEPQRAAAASANGRVKRINTLYLRFFETAGGTFGIRQVDPMTAVENVKTEVIPGRLAGYPLGQSPPAFTGTRRLPALGGYDREQQTMILQNDPLPMTVLALTANADVEEMPMPQ